MLEGLVSKFVDDLIAVFRNATLAELGSVGGVDTSFVTNSIMQADMIKDGFEHHNNHVFFVDPTNGKDTNNGTCRTPLKTFAELQRRIGKYPKNPPPVVTIPPKKKVDPRTSTPAKRVLAYLKKHKSVSASKVAKALDWTHQHAMNTISDLYKAGHVVRVKKGVYKAKVAK